MKSSSIDKLVICIYNLNKHFYDMASVGFNCHFFPQRSYIEESLIDECFTIKESDPQYNAFYDGFHDMLMNMKNVKDIDSVVELIVAGNPDPFIQYVSQS